MDFTKRIGKLSAAQRLAVETIEGPVMVVAGPGTGKTELLSMRVANILKQTDSLPENILCLTFTESGAAAMRERLIGIIGKDAYRVAIHTFHSFGTETINQNREYFYQGAQFQPADDLNRYEILRSIFKELDYKNPLASTMNDEYTYQPDATRVISELKKSGLTSDELLAVIDQNEATIDACEKILVPVLSQTVSKSTKDALAKVLPDIETLAADSEVRYEITPLAVVIYDSLSAAITSAEVGHPTKPVSAWKQRWFTKNAQGELVFKSRGSMVKLRALAFVYYEYLSRMEKAGLYDYDDMILQVVHAMEVHDDLRFNLQEKYQYIMVDEFQDTNLAQMRILHSLTDNPVNEGNPNIMVVGDDDQAIYSFQGADISNILRFQELFPSTTLVSLTDNYRSTDGVIDEARKVIVQGHDRLETRIETLSKVLKGHQAATGLVSLHSAASITQERHWLTQQIRAQVEKGIAPNEIVVLTRKHREIEALLPYFAQANIPVQYERKENLLDQPPVLILELLAKTIVALARGQHDEVNAQLPELLAHPAWGVTAAELWQLSVDAYERRTSWMELMQTTPRFTTIHSWLIEAAQLSHTTSLEVMLDHLIGRSTEEEQAESTKSPFYEYFFSEKTRETSPATYIDYLSALRTIRNLLREYHPEQKATLETFLHFITLHRRLGTQLSVAHAEHAVNPAAIHLMTAHKSKGLEFEHVYVVNAVDSIWGEKARQPSSTLRYPENLTLAPVGDNLDERIRLFYVAMTRAKHSLTLSFSESDDKGRTTLPASFLSNQHAEEIPLSKDTTASQLEIAETAWYTPLVEVSATLTDILVPSLERYKLSATHFNNFLDVTKGGPQSFLLNNLLHFPSAKSAPASYGSAVHSTLQQVHTHLAKTGELKPLEDILHDFEVNLSKERMDALDTATYLQKGSEQLRAYLAERQGIFNARQKSELDFRSQEVVLDDAKLTGLLDVVEFDKESRTAIVSDYKTGKPIVGGKASSEYEKIKLHKYTQQLMFYKLLVEGSRDFRTYTVTSGVLEFIEPSEAGTVEHFDTTFTDEEMATFKKLVAAVWRHISTLTLPDISSYDPSYKGILAFEKDLIDTDGLLTKD